MRNYQVRSSLDFEPFAEALANSVRGSFGGHGETQIREVEGRTPKYCDRDCIVDIVIGFTVKGHARRVAETDEVRIATKPTDKVYELVVKPETLRELFDKHVVDKAVEYVKPEDLPSYSVPSTMVVRKMVENLRAGGTIEGI